MVSHFKFSSPEGNQPKRTDGKYFFKNDYFGGEAISECLVSLFLESSNLPNSYFVSYRLGDSPSISISESYKPRYQFLSFDDLLLNTIIPKECPKLLSSVKSTYFRHPLEVQKLNLRSTWVEKVWNRLDIKDRPRYIASRAERYLGVSFEDTMLYLTIVNSLDTLFFNYDRHFQNFGFMFDRVTKCYITSKVFDNGMSLGGGIYDKSIKNSLLLDKVGNEKFQPYATLFKNNKRALKLFKYKNYRLSFSPENFLHLLNTTEKGNLQYILASDFWKTFKARLITYNKELTEIDLNKFFKENNL